MSAVAATRRPNAPPDDDLAGEPQPGQQVPPIREQNSPMDRPVRRDGVTLRHDDHGLK
jgi:hypothetical protein